MGTRLGPKYIPYTYMDPVGNALQVATASDPNTARTQRQVLQVQGIGDFSTSGVPLGGVPMKRIVEFWGLY